MRNARVAPAGECGVCREPLVGEVCGNTVCLLVDREFSEIFTVSEDADRMWDLIWRYKYGDEKHRAEELANLLLRYMHDHRGVMERFDLIATCALYVGPRASRLWDYLKLVVEAAERQDPGWPFVPDLITKSGPTGRFLGIGVEARRGIAEGDLRAALAVADPGIVAGKRVLVFDDVYSEGFSLREMARVLRLAGAAEVAGLVFCRKKGA